MAGVAYAYDAGSDASPCIPGTRVYGSSYSDSGEASETSSRTPGGCVVRPTSGVHHGSGHPLASAWVDSNTPNYSRKTRHRLVSGIICVRYGHNRPAPVFQLALKLFFDDIFKDL